MCETLGADVHDIAKGMGMDRRIGPKFLHPGPGYGGSCFPKDTKALLTFAKENGHDLGIVKATIEANEKQISMVYRKIEEALAFQLKGKVACVLGVTFKPETDDIRDSPALKILPKLLKDGVKVKLHDPKGLAAAKMFSQKK